MNVKKFQAVFTITQFILLFHVIAATGAHPRTPALRVIDIKSVSAYPAFVHLDVKITVIDHMPEPTLFTYHRTPFFVVFYYRTHTYLVQGLFFEALLCTYWELTLANHGPHNQD